LRELGPDFYRVARRLGWELAPDLATAERAVASRAAELAGARRRRRSARVRAGLIAALAMAVVVAGWPALAGFGVSGRPIAHPPRAVRAATRPAANETGVLDGFSDVPMVGVTMPRASGSADQVPSCNRDDVTVETEFGRDVYAPGDAAVITLILRNASGAACSAQADRCTSEISVFDAGGTGVYSSVAHRYLCEAPGQAGPAQPVRQVLQPGQEMTMTFQWLGQDCAGAGPGLGCGVVAPGRYTVTGDWAGFPTAGSEPAVLSPEYRLTTLPRHVTIA
jgi:hypothetical protein